MVLVIFTLISNEGSETNNLACSTFCYGWFICLLNFPVLGSLNDLLIYCNFYVIKTSYYIFYSLNLYNMSSSMCICRLYYSQLISQSGRWLLHPLIVR